MGVPREEQQIKDQFVQSVQTTKDLPHDARLLAVAGKASTKHLNRTANGSQWISHFVGEHGSHFTNASQSRLFADAFFQLCPRAEIVHDSHEMRLIGHLHLTHGEMRGKQRAIAPARLNVSTDTDHRSYPRSPVAFEMLIVLFTIGRRHEHADILANDLGRRVSEDPLRRRIEGFNDTPGVNNHHAIDRGVEKRLPS